MGCDGVQIALLQELNSDLCDSIRELCRSTGWAACFSSANSDPTKCDAITGIITKEPFDEEAQFEVQENKKVRHFAACRRGDVWVVSCHVPLQRGVKAELSNNETVGEKLV